VDQRRPAFVVVAILWSLSFLIVLPSSAAAQQGESIEGTQLQPMTTMDQAVGNALGDILNTKPEGEIKQVTVTRERAASLRLSVEYDGFEGNWLKGEVLRAGDDGDPEPISQIEVEPIELDSSGSAELEFALGEDTEEGASFASNALVILVAKRAYHRTGAKSTFVLSKTWEAATRAENVEITVYANALQDLPPTGYKKAPEPGSRPELGPADDEKAPEYVRLRADRGRYLSADEGGGGSVRLASGAGDDETFQLGWLDQEADIGRLRTANGWHLVALRPDGRIDATSADPADPATILHFQYNGDGTYIVQAADAATAKRMTGAAQESRLKLLARPSTADLVKRQSVQVPARNLNINRQLTPAANLNKSNGGSSGSNPLTMFRSGGSVTAKPYRSGSKRDAAFYFERNAPIPKSVGKPGDAAGPSRDPIFDLEEIPVMQGYVSGRTVEDAPDIEDLLGINSQIWADENLGSGIYYYVPSAYYLKWDPDKDYDLSLTDEMAGEDGSPEVLVRARLAPRFTPVQRRAAEILVRQGARAYGRPFFELREMPIASEATQSTAAEALAGHYRIDNVVVRPPDDAMGEAEISWRMPSLTRESFVELLREDQSVAPEILLQPSSGEAGLQRIPLYMGWGEPESYPAILWENGSFKRNQAPHPIRLDGLHVLVLDRNDKIQMLSWDLSNTAIVPSKARIKMNQELTRPVIDNAFFTWVDYSVIPDDASTEAAVRSITGGVSEQVRQPLSITLFDPLAASGAQQLTVFVKSRYFEADADKVTVRQFEFTEDNETQSVPFYLGRADVEVPFEWTVRLRMPDGSELEKPVFLEGDTGLQLIVSSSSLRQIFGDLPSEEENR
jgi:hypothetical protein